MGSVTIKHIEIKDTVAVIVLTYNQEMLIRECIESIISQKVSSADFSIHVIDDASVDDTRSVVEKYRNKYPSKILPWYWASNQYQIGKPPEFPIMEQINAKYICFCDGDDFWIDEYKIEKQLEVFRLDNSLAIVHTDYFFGEEDRDTLKLIRRTEKDRGKAKRIQDGYDLVYGNEIKKSTTMFRKNSIDFEFLRKCNGIRAQDWLVAVSAAANGRVNYIDEPTTVYRISDKASFQSLTQEHRIQMKYEVRKFCAEHHPDKGIRKHFKRFLFRELLRKGIRSSFFYRPFRPLVIFLRRLRSKS